MTSTISSTGSVSTWRTYENWQSLSSSGVSALSRGSGGISSLSRSARCFQIKDPVGEQLITQNFYCGTRNFTPGPGSYEEFESEKHLSQKPVTFSFGNSSRILSESKRLYDSSDTGRYPTPTPFDYNIENPSTETYLKSKLAVSLHSLQILKDRYKSKEQLSIEKKKVLEREIQENYQPLVQKIKSIKLALQNIQNNNKLHRPRHPTPKKISFGSTEKRWDQIPDKIQEAPTFYTSDADWDFGTQSRVGTINMNSFQYTTKLNEEKREEIQSDINKLEGLSRSRPRTRQTDFFGPNEEKRNHSPPVGLYHPELLPQTKRTSTVTKEMSNSILRASEKKKLEKLKDISKNKFRLSKFSDNQKEPQNLQGGSLRDITRKMSTSTISSFGAGF